MEIKSLKVAAARAALLAMTLLLIAGQAFAWDNPHKAAAPGMKVPADQAVQIRLENRRVQNINGDTFAYKTNGKTLTIQADSPASRQFLRDVQSGRTSACATVTLTPRRKSPFNTEYKAR